MTPICERCGASLAGGGLVCTGCITGHRQNLRWLAANLDELDAARWRQARLGRGTGRPGAADRLPFDAEASEAAWVTANTAAAWAEHTRNIYTGGTYLGPACRECIHLTCDTALRDRNQLPFWGTPVRVALAYLAAPLILEWTRHREWASQVVDEFGYLVKLITHTIDRVGETVALGPCGNMAADGFECVQALRASLDADWVSCPTCRATYRVIDRKIRLLSEMDDRIERPKVIADVLAAYGIKAPYSTIRTWAERGRLIPADRDEKGRPLYRVGDVRALAQTGRFHTPTHVTTTAIKALRALKAHRLDTPATPYLHKALTS